MFGLFVILAQQQQQQAPTAAPFDPMYLWIILIWFFVFMVWLPSRKAKKQQQQMLAALKKKDKVLTTSGIIGVVDNVKDDEVSLKIDENSPVRLRVIKSSIDRVLVVSEEGSKDKDKEEG